jgi:hypothetical protein
MQKLMMKRRRFPLLSLAITSALCCPTLVQAALAATCDGPITAIAEIQGSADKSPLTGKTVSTRGVVLAVLYADSKQPQVLLGSLQADNNPATAESILLSGSNLASQISAGDVLAVSGTVRELNGMTALTNLTAHPSCGRQPLPVPTTVRLPVQQLSDWEAFEGMQLSFTQPLIVNDSYGLARYGELLLADQRLPVPTEVVAPGQPAADLAKQQLLHEITIDDGSMKQNPPVVRFPTGNLSAQNTVRVGDTVNKLQGFLLPTKQGWRLVVSQQPEFVTTNARPAAPAKKAADELRVASFNVLNFFTGDGTANAFPTTRGASTADELSRQQAKMIAALSAMDADIIGLLEVQNNGFARGSAIVTLVDALNAAVGAKQYAFVQPEQKPGSDEIMVALIYRPSRVSQAGKAAVLTTPPFDRGSRPPLAQSFTDKQSGKTLTVSINHFKSKGSCPKQDSPEADKGDGQGCWTPSRVKAAQAMTAWLKANPTGVDSELRLIMGDLNAYRQEQPLQVLENLGWVHMAGPRQAGPHQAGPHQAGPRQAGLKEDGNKFSFHSSFVFRGRSGSLDHALASPALKAQLSRFAHWHINADEPAVLDYNTEFKSTDQQQQLYAPTPFRSSDHDPLYMDFKF